MENNLLGQAVDAACKVLGHGTAFNSLDTHPLQNLGEPADKKTKRLRKGMLHHRVRGFSYKSKQLLLHKVGVAIKFATMFQAPGPGENAGNGVGAGGPSLKAELWVMSAFLITE